MVQFEFPRLIGDRFLNIPAHQSKISSFPAKPQAPCYMSDFDKIRSQSGVEPDIGGFLELVTAQGAHLNVL